MTGFGGWGGYLRKLKIAFIKEGGAAPTVQASNPGRYFLTFLVPFHVMLKIAFRNAASAATGRIRNGSLACVEVGSQYVVGRVSNANH